MEVKKLRGLLMGLLLLVGVSTSAMGQYTIRVVRPDSGKVVAIGDSVVVTVQNTLPGALTSVNVKIVQAASTTDTITTTAAIASAYSKAAVDVSVANSPATWRASFIVQAGDPTKISKLAVVATVVVGSSTTPVSNLDKSVVGSTIVGDGRLFGIAGQRPQTANIDTIFLDANTRPAGGKGYTTRDITLPTDNGYGGSLSGVGNATSVFKAGDVVGVNIVLQPGVFTQLQSKVLSGAVVLIDSAGTAGFLDQTKSRAKVVFDYSTLSSFDTTKAVGTDTLYATTAVKTRFPNSNIARKTITLSPGQFPNNANVQLQGFLYDAAGNLSGVNVNDASPTGVTSSQTYRIDTVVPAIATIYPDSTGKRFTGMKGIFADTINALGTAKQSSYFRQNPLRWTLSEPADSLVITVGGKTWTRGATSAAFQATSSDSLNVYEALTGESTRGTLGTTGLSGASLSVTLTVYDLVGNSSGPKTVTGVVFDTTALSFQGQFPKMINHLGKDTVNTQTSSAVFALSEVADSVRVTYRKLNSSSGTVTTARGQSGGNVNINLTSLTAQRIDVNTDSLKDQSFYSLQLFGRDLAYNWTVTGPDTLFYNIGFKNPNSDSIKVLVSSGSNDTAVVNASGAGVLFDVSAVDTLLGNNAVTYNPNGVLVDVWSADTTANLVGVHIKGTGVTEQAAIVTESGVKRKRANLDNGGWVLGARQLTISDTLAQNKVYVSIRDTVSTKKIKGQSQAVVFEAGQMTQYKLMAASPVSITADTPTVNANQVFSVNVQPQDKYSNSSLKQADKIYTSSSGGNALGEIYVEFASDAADLGVPPGPQRLNSATAWYAFDFEAPNRNDMFRITARTANVRGIVGTYTVAGDSTSTQGRAVGHLWLRTTGAGGVVTPPPGGNPAIQKPDTLIVEDYKGPDGSGDQGGFVLATFKNTTQHAQLSLYRIWREMLVSTDYDTTTGRIRSLATPKLQWVPWAVVDAVPVLKDAPPITRAVIPTIDGVATRWAITAEMGPGSSEAATSSAAAGRAGKVVYSPESVKETLALLNIQSVMTEEEIAKVFSPAYEVSVLGDQKNLLLGRLDLDALRQAVLRVPDAVRAQTASIQASDATLAVAAIRAIDNIPPAAVSSETEAHEGRQVTLTWKASTDDRVVGFIPYRGYAISIPGVRTYDVFRAKDEGPTQVFQKIASLPAGSVTFKDVVDPGQGLGNKLVYRITATDLDNATQGRLVAVDLTPLVVGPIKYFTAKNEPVFLMLAQNDPTFNLTEDFDDFFSFADSFGLSKGQKNYNLQADTDNDGDVDFDDFFAFADAFGRVAVLPKSGKPLAGITPISGVNRDAELKLTLASDRILAGQQVKLDVNISNAAALKGYGFTLTYDPQKFELVEATAGDQNLLMQGGSTPVFLKITQPGRIQIANAISGDGAVAGSGSVAQLVFNVKGEFEDARFEIADAVLIDGSRHLNPVLTLDALNVQTAPKEFALHQNFPNPFNPETTIKYELAASGQVELRIYNMVGQVVRTLVNERQAAARYSIRWDGKDDRGLSVSSGIYFYSLSADKFHTVKKLMLLK